MSTLSFIRKWCLPTVPLMVTACSTPQPILDLAGQGAATVELAEISLREYINLTHSQLAARMELIRIDAQQEARDRARREFDLLIDRMSGIPAREESSELLMKLGAESRKIREREKEDLEKIGQSNALDAATLPQVPTEKLAAAKKSFQVLAQELSPSEWLALAAAYAKEIQAGVQKLQTPTEENKSSKE